MTEARTNTLEAAEQRIAKLAQDLRQTREEIGRELLVIRDGELYRERGYPSFTAYLGAESGGLWGLTEQECGRLTLDYEAIESMRAVEPAGSLPSVQNTRILRRNLDSPEEMLGAYEHHQESGRPFGRNREGLVESIKEFKGERVRDVLPPEQMADLPDAKLSEGENWVFEAKKIAAALRRLTPENVAAEASFISSPEELGEYALTADEVAEWFTRYAAELRARAEQKPLRAVK